MKVLIKLHVNKDSKSIENVNDIYNNQGFYYMNFESFIEITQDGAGVILRNEQKVRGFFTSGIQCCLIIVFICNQATILVHDS